MFEQRARSFSLIVLMLAASAVLFLLVTRRNAVTSTDPSLNPTLQPASNLPVAEKIEPPAGPAATKEGFVGTILARESIEVAAKFEGRLESVRFNLGDHVARNAVIATLDATQIRQELEMAEASLRVSKAESRRAELLLAEAKEKHERRIFLAANGIFSKEQLKDTQYQVDLGAAGVDVAEARVAEQTSLITQLKERLANTEIRSPFEGTVSARHQNPGAIISRGTPILTLIRSGDLWIRFTVPTEESRSVKIRGGVTINIENLNLSLDGVIENVSPGVDNTLQMMIVEARLRVPADQKIWIKPGLVGRVLIKN